MATPDSPLLPPPGRDTWRPGWDDELRGVGCPFCAKGSVDEDAWGVRVLDGEYVDAYLSKHGQVPGYTYVIWKRGHVAEPTALSAQEASGYWLEVLDVARALEAVYRPRKTNYETLGNAIPHLHTHVVPRPADDPAPNGPLPWDVIDGGLQDEAVLRAGVAAVRAALADRPAPRR